MSRHILTQFDAELDEVREQVILMGRVVEKQIQLSLQALINNDVNLMEQVIENDTLVNSMEVTIDEKCVQIIACRQPAANDLRLVMTVIKTITDMERIGDEAKKISRLGSPIVHSLARWGARLSTVSHVYDERELRIRRIARSIVRNMPTT